ncbi:unnamed protein product [Dicrocoelium dendriticum]|nr:unnamed protein product [Dicrocoelium dendriticum]
MAQRLLQSFRRLPGNFATVKKKAELSEVHGSSYKINVCADFGFPSKPTSIAYDSTLDLLALLTRDGNLSVFGKPGVVFTGAHNNEAEFIQVLFIVGEGHANELDDDADSWPPFRHAGVFDPFIDDNRVSVQVIKLVDNTVIVGGAAGQITVWQFLDHAPPLIPANVILKTELPGFHWKGHSPLKLQTGVEHGVILSTSPAQLQAVGVLMVQPPGRCTSLGLAEAPTPHRDIKTLSVYPAPCSIGVLVALGTPHGFGVVFLPPSKPPPTTATDQSISQPPAQWEPVTPVVLLAETTLPDNLDALQEAAAGEGWARRRTRELKKSLRDSFRRLKRMRSTKAATTEVQPTQISRAGIRRTVTQNNRAIGRTVNSGPLEDAETRVMSLNNTPVHTSSGFPPVSVEREICDRPLESASTAIVSCFAFGPPLFRFSTYQSNYPTNQPVGSLFVGTKAGIVKAYALFTDVSIHSSVKPSMFRLQLAKQLILQHRAPLLNLRLVDGKSYFPFSPHSLNSPLTSPVRPTVPPCLLVTTEEQVRLFSLPALRLRYKARITAKDGYRIKAGALVSFRLHSKSPSSNDKSADVDSACGDLDRSAASSTSTPSHHIPIHSDMHSSEFSYVFTNVGGQAVILSVPHLTRKDTFGLLDLTDVVAVSSVVFAEPGCSSPPSESTVSAPSLGLYQLAPGQLTLFDVVRTGQRASLLGASYRPVHRLPPLSPSATGQFVRPMTTEIHTATSNGPSAGSFSSSQRFLQPLCKNQQPSSSHNTTVHSGSYASSQVNSSLLSNTLSDSVRDCVSSPSGSSVVSDQHIIRR